MAYQALLMVNPSINDKSACVCCKYFYEEDFISVILLEFGPTKLTLADASFVLTQYPSIKRPSKVNIAQAEHQDIIVPP